MAADEPVIAGEVTLVQVHSSGVTGAPAYEGPPPVWVVTLAYDDQEVEVFAVYREDPGEGHAEQLARAFELTEDNRRWAHVRVHGPTHPRLPR